MSDIQQDIIELAEEHAMYSSTLTIEKYERVRGHIDDLTKQLAELEAKLEAVNTRTRHYITKSDGLTKKLEAAEKVYNLGASLSATAAKDEDESRSILGYVIYAPPWLMNDFDAALAAFEEKLDE